jgi:hypothetical protein
MKLNNKIKWFIKDFDYLKSYNSPFKPPKLEFYFGKIALGTPYFLPRKWVKATPELAIKAAVKSIRETRRWNKNNPNYARREKPFRELYDEKMKYLHAVPKKIGFNFVGLGWKTKWKHDDYRFEYSPMISFVFFKWQIAITFVAPHIMHYWEPWLYYARETNKKDSIPNRIAQCRKNAPQTWTRHNSDGTKETTDYYDLILKKKWL